jgi:glucose/arabinose dehydrogenase
MIQRLYTFLCVLSAASGVLWAGTPPPGFVETLLMDDSSANGAPRPTGVAYEPGTGDLWVLEQGPRTLSGSARVRVRDAESGEVRTVHVMDCLDSRGERGLLGIAFSPDYLSGSSSRHVYIFYTRYIASDGGACSVPGQAAGTKIRVSRFLESGGSLSGEQPIFESPYLRMQTNHNGGTIRFAPDGTLFISIGDNDTDAEASPLSRDLGDPRGKLLRVHPDGSAPADNPFFDEIGVLPEIYAWGLRNPFRFSVDSATGVPFIGDVGEATWEAVYAGPAGADYGYPCYEGSAPYRTCNPAPAPGSVTDPILVYGHGSQTPPLQGYAITGGPVYRATQFPEEYRGNYYFSDYASGWIYRGRVTVDNELADIQLFMADAGAVVDLIVSPAGCLTYADLFQGVFDVCFDDPNADNDGDGFTIADGDCDDGRPETFPGAPDLCNGEDDSCSGTADDDSCDRYQAAGIGRVDGIELAWVGRAFGLCSADPAAQWWSPVDYTLDGCVDGDDLSVLAAVFGCSGSAGVCE